MKPLISHDRLLSVLSYDSETGDFTWRVTMGPKARAGMRAGRPLSKDYWRVCVDQQDYSAHRLAWFYVHGTWPVQEVDHINRIKNDNRIANLREATRAENHQNRDLLSSNKSGFAGVHLHSRSLKWRAVISVGGKKVRLGEFPTKELAGAAYASAKAKLHTFHPTAEASA